MPWGEINRYQRISSDINQQFNDKEPNYPVAFASSLWVCQLITIANIMKVQNKIWSIWQ